MVPIPIRVPTHFCVLSTLTADQANAAFVVIGSRNNASNDENEPKLLPSKMHLVLFANLTLGAMSGQGDASTGHPSVLSVDDIWRAKIVVACAQLKVSSHSRPFPQQAVHLAALLHIPTHYGEALYRDLLSRLLSFIDRNINLDKLPAALTCQNHRVYWLAHTRAWDATTTVQDIEQQQASKQFRAYQTPCPLGFKRILDQAVRSLAASGTFDELNYVAPQALPSSAAAKIPSTRQDIPQDFHQDARQHARQDTFQKLRQDLRPDLSQEAPEPFSPSRVLPPTPPGPTSPLLPPPVPAPKPSYSHYQSQPPPREIDSSVAAELRRLARNQNVTSSATYLLREEITQIAGFQHQDRRSLRRILLALEEMATVVREGLQQALSYEEPFSLAAKVERVTGRVRVLEGLEGLDGESEWEFEDGEGKREERGEGKGEGEEKGNEDGKGKEEGKGKGKGKERLVEGELKEEK